MAAGVEMRLRGEMTRLLRFGAVGLSGTAPFLGIQLIFLGIIGAYLGRIYDEVKARPLVLIARTWGVEED
jgi:hypothetical protein